MVVVRQRPPRLLAIIGAAAWLACGEPSPIEAIPSAPQLIADSIAIYPRQVQIDDVGKSQLFSATVLDQNGDAIAVPVTWTTTAPAVATVDGSGLVTAHGAGFAFIHARAGSATDAVPVAVVPPGIPTGILPVSGQGQTAPILEQLPQPIVVEVRDRDQKLVVGAEVQFRPYTVDAGTVSPTEALTDSAGRASTRWTLSSNAGSKGIMASIGAPFNTAVGISANALPLAPHAVVKTSMDASGVRSGTYVSPSPSLRVQDRYGNGVPGVEVTFRVTRGGGQVSYSSIATTANPVGVAATSWTVDTTAVQEVTAVVAGEGLEGNPVTFTAQVVRPGKPFRLVAESELEQTGLEGYPVNSWPRVRVLDESGQPVWDAQVHFDVTSGGGSVTADSVKTNGDGVAQQGYWTIRHGANVLTARVGGLDTPLTFRATGVPSTFDIEVRYLNTLDQETRAAIDSAAARWSRVIFGDLPAMVVQRSAGTCGPGQIPAIDETVDDLLIFAVVEPIDGPGNVLIRGEPCVLRSGSLLPSVAIIQVDSADVAMLRSRDALPRAALHAMAHTLGFGVLWEAKGLLVRQSPLPVYVGVQARTARRQMDMEYEGGPIPVEDGHISQSASNPLFEGAAGAADVHWAGWIYDVMMAQLFQDDHLAYITVGQFADLGYQVNLGAADYRLCFRDNCVDEPPVGTAVGRLRRR
jgi:hypothetical protein